MVKLKVKGSLVESEVLRTDSDNKAQGGTWEWQEMAHADPRKQGTWRRQA